MMVVNDKRHVPPLTVGLYKPLTSLSFKQEQITMANTRTNLLTVVCLCLLSTMTQTAPVDENEVSRDDPIDIRPPYCYCPKGFVRMIRKDSMRCFCYKFVRDLASWAEATIYCDVIHAELLQIKDNFEKQWIDQQLYPREFTYHHHLLEKPEYWIGATDIALESYFRWYRGSIVSVPLSYWLPNEPNNYLGYQNCLAIRRRCWDAKCIIYGWFDDDCYQKKFYICKRKGLRGPVREIVPERAAAAQAAAATRA